MDRVIYFYWRPRNKGRSQEAGGGKCPCQTRFPRKKQPKLFKFARAFCDKIRFPTRVLEKWKRTDFPRKKTSIESWLRPCSEIFIHFLRLSFGNTHKYLCLLIISSIFHHHYSLTFCASEKNQLIITSEFDLADFQYFSKYLVAP